jgi:glycerol-3-phosphate acyltransferase PlsY
MENTFTLVAWLLGAYLVGSVPFGFLIGKMRGVDVRTVG